MSTGSRLPAPAAAALLVAGAVGLALGGGAAGARLAQEVGDRPATARSVVEAEVDAMLDAGIPPDDQKVRMLRDELAALEALEEADPVAEPGVDLQDVARGTGRASPSGTAPRPGHPDEADREQEWEHGPVECEPIPQKLGIEEIASATCLVEPLPGGGARYLAVTPDGTEHEVRFP